VRGPHGVEGCLEMLVKLLASVEDDFGHGGSVWNEASEGGTT